VVHDVGIPGPGWEQSLKCGRIKLVNGILICLMYEFISYWYRYHKSGIFFFAGSYFLLYSR